MKEIIIVAGECNFDILWLKVQMNSSDKVKTV